MWRDLSQKEKFDLIREYIRNGYNDLDDIMGAYNGEIVNKYGDGGAAGFVDLLRSRGYKFRVTSSYRPGAVTSSGHPSNHAVKGRAADVVPLDENFDAFRAAIYSDPVVVRYMLDNSIGILEEITPAARKKYGSTGNHFHIGPDTAAIRMRDNNIKAFRTGYHPMQDVTWQDVQNRRARIIDAPGMSDEANSRYYQALADNNPDLSDDGQVQTGKRYDPFSFMDEPGFDPKKERLQAYFNVMNGVSEPVQSGIQQDNGYQLFV